MANPYWGNFSNGSIPWDENENAVKTLVSLVVAILKKCLKDTVNFPSELHLQGPNYHSNRNPMESVTHFLELAKEVRSIKDLKNKLKIIVFRARQVPYGDYYALRWPTEDSNQHSFTFWFTKAKQLHSSQWPDETKSLARLIVDKLQSGTADNKDEVSTYKEWRDTNVKDPTSKPNQEQTSQEPEQGRKTESWLFPELSSVGPPAPKIPKLLPPLAPKIPHTAPSNMPKTSAGSACMWPSAQPTPGYSSYNSGPPTGWSLTPKSSTSMSLAAPISHTAGGGTLPSAALLVGPPDFSGPSNVQPVISQETRTAIWHKIFVPLAEIYSTDSKNIVFLKEHSAGGGSASSHSAKPMPMLRTKFEQEMSSVNNLNELVNRFPWLLCVRGESGLNVPFKPHEVDDETVVYMDLPRLSDWWSTPLGTAGQLKALGPWEGKNFMGYVKCIVTMWKLDDQQLPLARASSFSVPALPQHSAFPAPNVKTESGPLRHRRLEEEDEAAAFRRREGTFNWRMKYDADGQAVECFDSFIHVPENPAGGSAVEAAKEITSHSDVEDRCGGTLGGVLGCCAAAVASSFSVGLLIRWLWQRKKGKATKKPKPDPPRQTPTTPPADIRRGKPGPATEELDEGPSTPAPSFANATTSKP
eukprot:GHVT01085298.1.p1 GENE.GHVT01085298.1~~GHVT01085298.1.p1  ORF type:complete len:667 (+),score=92.29 GHVT01085298.1:79-2001(+)